MTDSTNPISGFVAATTVVSNDDWRYAVMYSLDNGMIVGRESVPGPAGFEAYKLTNKIGGVQEASDMGLPVLQDAHCYPGIAILGDGRVAIWGNMHGGTRTNDAFRMMVTTDLLSPGYPDITSWSPGTLPSIGPSCAYPTPVQLPDGRVFFMIRDVGISSEGDWGCWFCPAGSSTFGARQTIFRGLTVPNAKDGSGPGGDGDPNLGAGSTQYNWSCYPPTPVVQDLGGGHYVMHVMGVWRVFGFENQIHNAFGVDIADIPAEMPANSNVHPFYMQYWSWTDTWHGIDGTQVTLPVDPVNTTAIRTGLVATDNRGGPSTFDPVTHVMTSPGWNYGNQGGMCVDSQGFPHYLLGRSPVYHIWWDGSAWQQTRLCLADFDVTMGPYYAFTAIKPVFVKGALWWLSSGGRITDPPRLLLATPDGSSVVRVGNVLPNSAEAAVMMGPNPPSVTFAETLMFTPDPEAMRRRGTVEVMVPVGDTMKSYVWGRSSRRRVA